MKSNNKIVKHQAPRKKFNKLVDRYMASIAPKNSRKQADINKLFSQYSAITSDIRLVVTSIPQVIAKPVIELNKIELDMTDKKLDSMPVWHGFEEGAFMPVWRLF